MATELREIKSIGIAGAGGIGGYVCKLLYDFGVNRKQFPFSSWKIDVYDDDVVDVGNLLHQDFSFDDLGREKAQIMAEKYAVDSVLRFMTKEDFSKYDVILSCVDSMTFRKDLYTYGWENPGKLFWIDGRCSSRNIGLYTSDIPKAKIEKDINDNTVRYGCLRQVDKENNTSHITPVIIAAMMMQTFLNHLRGEKLQDKLLLMI